MRFSAFHEFMYDSIVLLIFRIARFDFEDIFEIFHSSVEKRIKENSSCILKHSLFEE